MVAEKDIVQQRGHHVLQGVRRKAARCGDLAAGHAHNAVKPGISRAVRQLHQVVRLTVGIFGISGRQPEAGRP